MTKQNIINQAIELYLLGIELEIKRKELCNAVVKNGEQSEEATQTFEAFKELAEKFDTLEKRHLEQTQRFINLRRV